ncbi:MAG: TetR/AcrR family transcriptional regulator [Burkholderiales bacterium]|nr:TetR/AcrR family transcriptional regulator [Burkholderiales bacterium]
MRQTPERRQQVLVAANELIAAGGLAGFSMLALAQHQRMSKETLYAWFGSKDQFLQELIRGNAGEMVGVLRRGASAPLDDAALRKTLEVFCVALLKLLTSDRSVAINRAVVHRAEGGSADSTLRAQGRDVVVAALVACLAQAQATGALSGADANMADVLIALALRDWQIERLVGRMAEPTPRSVNARSREAVELFMRLYGNP